MRPRIATKLSVLLMISLLPLILSGVISLWQFRRATIRSVSEGNANVSQRASKEIAQYVTNALRILESTAENMSHLDLQNWQKERTLKNYRNRFDEFNSLVVWNVSGQSQATSELSLRPMSHGEKEVFENALKGSTSLSSVFIKDDLTPAMFVAVPIRRLAAIEGILTAELNLLQMWYTVDQIRVGQTGVLHVLDREGRFIATGDGERKKEVFEQKIYQPEKEKKNVLVVSNRLPDPLAWTVILSQPTAEAFGLANRVGWILAIVLVVMVVVASLWGTYGGKRQVINPIRDLQIATEEIARGNLDYRVSLKTRDEFEILGEAFNQMSIRLKDFQGKLLRQERHAMFGRIASGLAHDLKHPIQAIENVSRLMDTMHEDPEFRKTFRRTVDREFSKISLFLNNLHNLTHELPYHPVPLHLVSFLQESYATFEVESQKNGIQVLWNLPSEEVSLMGDRTSLGRLFSNLISNAIQAMGPGGTLTLGAQAKNGKVTISVHDTGTGIPQDRLATLFEDFVTTKGRGLGLGLAIVQKIVQQHGGKIDVESSVGQGTTFQVTLPHQKT